MLEETARGGVSLSLLPSIAQLMDTYLERGHAHDDWTVITKDSLR
jgi:3-hydroxyisobutyrate dehydrogenase